MSESITALSALVGVSLALGIAAVIEVGSLRRRVENIRRALGLCEEDLGDKRGPR